MSADRSIHLKSEGKMSFDTPAGRVFLEAGEESTTPFGGFVPLAAFLQKSGFLHELADTSPVHRTSPNASKAYDIICSFILTTLIDGSRFTHVNRLREDSVLKELFGLERIVSDDTIRRYFKQIDRAESGRWIGQITQPMWSCLPNQFILDWDSTVQTRYGKQEGCEVGYNHHKPGRPSHHPLLAVVAGTRLCPYYRLRSGKVPQQLNG